MMLVLPVSYSINDFIFIIRRGRGYLVLLLQLILVLMLLLMILRPDWTVVTLVREDSTGVTIIGWRGGCERCWCWWVVLRIELLMVAFIPCHAVLSLHQGVVNTGAGLKNLMQVLDVVDSVTKNLNLGHLLHGSNCWNILA